MENNVQGNSSFSDMLKFENELLKLKLQAEFGMEPHGDVPDLSPEVENMWLNNIYAFEAQFKNAKRITVFDALGCPDFKKVDDLSDEEVSNALSNIRLLMDKRGVALDTCCQYEARTIYRFITDELFQCEMDDISIPGMVCHFIYEEYYPNHEYDLRGETEQFIRNLLERKWDPEFNIYSLADSVTLKGKSFNRNTITSLITDFQSGREFEIKKLDILGVTFDIIRKRGEVNGKIEYRDLRKHPDEIIRGVCEIRYIYDKPAWRVSRFKLPGI
jgi:hypothetical protein